MTTFAVAAPPPITHSPHPPTPESQDTPSPAISPTSISNQDRSTQVAPPERTATAHAPNAFLAKMDEMGKGILNKPQVTWAIGQGMSAREIAARYGIWRGGDAYKALENRVEARRLDAVGDGLGA